MATPLALARAWEGDTLVVNTWQVVSGKFFYYEATADHNQTLTVDVGFGTRWGGVWLVRSKTSLFSGRGSSRQIHPLDFVCLFVFSSSVLNGLVWSTLNLGQERSRLEIAEIIHFRIGFISFSSFLESLHMHVVLAAGYVLSLIHI